LEESKTEILDEHAKSPAVSDCMMNRKDQYMVIRAPAEHLGSVKRSLYQIKRLAEDLLCQFFDRVIASLSRRKLAKTEIRRAALTNHLQGAFLAREQREAQNLLPLHNPLKRSFAGLSSDGATQMNEAADVICYVCHGHGRRFPQFALGECQRLEAYSSAA
jgi:hypothetical protein